MHTDRLRSISAVCLFFLLTIGICLGGCSSTEEHATEQKVDIQAENGYTTAHFPSFELAVPEDWSVRGNVGKLYEGDGMFLLAGPLTEETEEPLEALETTLSQELQLFFNTEYYSSQTRFQYDSDDEGSPLRRVSGILRNDRNGTSMRFAGAFGIPPNSYFIYFWPDASGDREGSRRAEVSYENFRIL